MREPSASERAYRHVKERVLNGKLPGGELISEGEIAEALGMSRTPVRAAFAQLESEGLLRLYPKRGALVVPVSAQELEDVIETRWVIERYAIERAIGDPGELPARLVKLAGAGALVATPAPAVRCVRLAAPELAARRVGDLNRIARQPRARPVTCEQCLQECPLDRSGGLP